MTNSEKRASGSSEGSGATPQLSRDELLAQQHEEYIKKVTESGIPIWVLDAYHNGGNYGS